MKCISPKTIWPHRSIDWCDRNEEYPVSVPCGKCLACLSTKRSDWAFRLEQEHKYSTSAYFITLTYDQKHYPSDGSLDKKHVQDFMKRLRKKDVNKLRYYLVGEYGTISGRAHYHMLLFNVSSSEFVRQAWCDYKGNAIGIVHIGNVTGASVAYVLKYLVQPIAGDDGRQKPFALMSRGYGLGARYLSDDMVDWHRHNDANYSIRQGVKIRLNRFYKSKIWYNEQDKERVGKAALLRSLSDAEKELSYYKKTYGDSWERVMIEFRDAVISRISKKVAFSQTI